MNPLRLIVVAGLMLFGLYLQVAKAAPIEHVIHISVDGLHPAAVPALISQGQSQGQNLVPNFSRLRTQGAFTDNARTDPEVAYTLPNHASQVTGRHTSGDAGHGWVLNDDAGERWNLHLSKTVQTGRISYVASVFDIVHDNGLSTALYANWSHFRIFHRSWNNGNGARDRFPPDNGRDKIDTFVTDEDMATVTSAFVDDMAQRNYTYAFLHLKEPDATGHAANWDLTPGSLYLEGVKAVDASLGMIFKLVDENPELAGRTAIILTTDHSGELWTTFHVLLPPIFVGSGIIPFYVWGPGVTAGADLYGLNPATRANPDGEIPPASASRQPIRNGDAANLSLDLLGLFPVPGSTINRAQDLSVQ
jgi:predicted AlkP superfamily pyrophosphatase or phosphodiesterase